MVKNYAIAGLLVAMSAPALAGAMPMDQPVQVNGLDTVCTGIGESKDDPRWLTYPIRIEFSNGGAQYLSGATVKLSRGGKTVGELDCPGAWVLLKGTPGIYRIDASIDNSNAKPVNVSITMGSGKQKRVVLRFPDFQPNE